MAESKKSFVLYTDLIHTVRKMPKDKAGELLLTILEYVNDENPEPNDLMIEVVFEGIKQQMKRDLIKWDAKKERLSAAGKASAEAKKAAKEAQQTSTPDNKLQHTLTNVENEQQSSTISTVSVNANVNVNVIKEVVVEVDAGEEIEISEEFEEPVYVSEVFSDEEERIAAVTFLKTHSAYTHIQKNQKLKPPEVLKLFDVFFDQKIALGELKGKTKDDIIKNFYWWVPKHLIANKQISKSNGTSNNQSAGNRQVSSSPDSKRADRHETLGKLRNLLQGTQPE